MTMANTGNGPVGRGVASRSTRGTKGKPVSPFGRGSRRGAAADRGPSRSTCTCLVVEDNLLLGQLLAGMLRTLPGIGDVALASTPAAAIAAGTKRRFDLVILNDRMCGGGESDVLQPLVARHPHLACILLSQKAEACVCHANCASNVRSRLDTTAGVDRLSREIERIVRGHSDGGAGRWEGDPTDLLRPRELDVFRRIGRGLTTRGIAAELGITVHTVNTHRKGIVAKLGVVGAELVRFAAIHSQATSTPGHRLSAAAGSRRRPRLPGAPQAMPDRGK